MRRPITTILPAFLCATGLIGCSGNNTPVATETGVHPVVITSGAATSTRTGYNYDKDGGLHRVEWRVGDRLGVFAYSDGHITGRNLNEPFEIKTAGDILENGAASFSGSFETHAEYTDETHVTASYYAYYPYQENASGNHETLLLTLPSTQTSSRDTFDGNADFLLGRPVENTVAPVGFMEHATTGHSVPVNFNFVRPLAITCFTLIDLPEQVDATETAATIEISVDEGLWIAGDFRATLCPEPHIEPAGGGSLISADGTNTITLTSDQTFGEGDIMVWLVMAPVTASTLKIRVETENWIIERAISKNLGFEAGKYNHSEISLATATVEAKTPAFVKVETEPADFTGDYLIVCGETGMALKNMGSNTYFSGANITAWLDGTKSKIEYNETTAGLVCPLEKRGDGIYSVFCVAEGKYIQTAEQEGFGANLYLDDYTGLDPQRFTVGIDGSGNAVISSLATPDRQILWRGSSYYFGNYPETTSATVDIQLYRLTGN